MKIPDNAAMADLDRRVREESGIPDYILMENAAQSMYRAFIINTAPGYDDLVLVLPGKGNNGGDALVFARQAFIEGYRTEILLLPGTLDTEKLNDPVSLSEVPLSLYWLKVAKDLGIPVHSWNSSEGRAALDASSFLVDGLFGTGLKGPLKNDFASLVEGINASGKCIVSLDIPGGLCDGFMTGWPCIQADETLCVEYPKACMYSLAGREKCGNIHVIKAGFPRIDPAANAELVDFDSYFRLHPLSPMPESSYKNRRGRCAIVAGGEGTLGAARLAATAAARSGAGLVSLYLSPVLYPLLAGELGGVMAKVWDTDTRLEDTADSLVIGPGLGWMGKGEQKQCLEKALSAGIPCVLDAEALDLVEFTGNRQKRPWILTPHPGEFLSWGICSRDELFSDTICQVKQAALKSGCVVVLKAHISCIASPDGKTFVYDGMNHALGTGGSGDVLAGLIGGLLASGCPPFEAAVCGVLLHGKAGSILSGGRGYFLAEELPEVAGRLVYRERRVRREK